ncbi:hypothetical protein HRG_013874 [Hirsutella rhossiliensis]
MLPHHPAYMCPYSRSRPACAYNLSAQLCQKPPFRRRALSSPLQWIPDNRRAEKNTIAHTYTNIGANRLPHTLKHTPQPFEHHLPHLAHQFSNSICDIKVHLDQTVVPIKAINAKKLARFLLLDRPQTSNFTVRMQYPSNYRRPSKKDSCNTTIISFLPSIQFAATIYSMER